MAKSKGKRGNAEGSVYFDETVNLWRGAVSRGFKVNAQGKTVRVRRQITAATRKEADDKLTDMRQRLNRNLPVGDGRSVGDLLVQWLESVRQDSSIREKTYRSYEQMVRNHLAPSKFPVTERKKHAPVPKEYRDYGLAKVKLAKLTIADVNAFLSAKLADGCSVPLVRYLRVVLRAGVSFAERADLVSRNVVKLSTLPKKARDAEPTEIEPFTPEEAKQLRETIRGHRLEALFSVALAVGLRHGEALGLQWPDFDAETATLCVFYQLQKVKGKLERVPTKSVKSRRVVHLPKVSVKSLLAHRERQQLDREFAGDVWRETGYVFTSTKGTPLLERNVLRDFTKMLERAKLPKRRIHDLRHTCVSLLAAEGVPLKTIAEIVGHSDIRLTQNIYQHVFSQEKKDAAKAMDRVFGS